MNVSDTARQRAAISVERQRRHWTIGQWKEQADAEDAEWPRLSAEVQSDADDAVDALLERVDSLEADLEGVHLALAEADIPRSAGVDEPLYSEQHRVRLLRARVDALTEALQEVTDFGDRAAVQIAEAALRAVGIPPEQTP